MPKINNPSTDDTCFYCTRQAFYVSVNTKRKRCQEKVTQCPAVTEKQQQSRDNNWTSLGDKITHMKQLSVLAHDKLKVLHEDEVWRSARAANITKAKEQIDTSGENNPMYGRTHSAISREKMVRSAQTRDNTNIGKYQRTQKHRNIASQNITKLLKEGRLFKSVNTKPEPSSY